MKQLNSCNYMFPCGGYPPIDIKFADRISYYNAFDEYHVKHNHGAMEKLLAGYVNARLDSYLEMLDN